MNLNQLPHYDQSFNTTGCCPKFNPEGWDDQELHFKDKPFARAETRSAMHIPLNMASVFARVQGGIEQADAFDEDNFIVLSHELSPWKAEHFFAVTNPLPGEEMTTLTGNFLTKVFEGPYREAKIWYEDMQDLAIAKGKQPGRVMFFYTTCPKCAKAYGKNYVVGVVEV